MITGVYKIQSILKPNRFYIGSSFNISARWQKHLLRLSNNKHENSKLQRHFNKYGVSDFCFSILVECKVEDLLKVEQGFLDSYKPHFNICKIAGRTTGYKHTESSKQKMRRPLSKEHKKKLSEVKQGYIPWNKGRYDLPPRSEETKRKQSAALAGKLKPRKPRPAAKK